MTNAEQAAMVLTKARHVANLLQEGNVCYASALLVQVYEASASLYDDVMAVVRNYIHQDDVSEVESLVSAILE